MAYRRVGMGGVLTDACYYACSVVNPNSLAACAVQCCADNPDPSDALCQTTVLPQSPAEMSGGILSDIADTLTGSYPGGSNAAAAADCAINPTFACWWQQNSSIAIVGVVAVAVLFAFSAVKR